MEAVWVCKYGRKYKTGEIIGLEKKEDCDNLLINGKCDISGRFCDARKFVEEKVGSGLRKDAVLYADNYRYSSITALTAARG